MKIVVLEQICVSPPYTKDDIKPLDKAVKHDFLERIATMVCFFLQRAGMGLCMIVGRTCADGGMPCD